MVVLGGGNRKTTKLYPLEIQVPDINCVNDKK